MLNSGTFFFSFKLINVCNTKVYCYDQLNFYAVLMSRIRTNLIIWQFDKFFRRFTKYECKNRSMKFKTNKAWHCIKLIFWKLIMYTCITCIYFPVDRVTFYTCIIFRQVYRMQHVQRHQQSLQCMYWAVLQLEHCESGYRSLLMRLQGLWSVNEYISLNQWFIVVPYLVTYNLGRVKSEFKILTEVTEQNLNTCNSGVVYITCSINPAGTYIPDRRL